MPFEVPRILPESELNVIRGKALVGHASPAEIMSAFSHFDLVLGELRKLRGCFPDKIYIYGAYGENWSAEEPDQNVEHDEVCYYCGRPSEKLCDFPLYGAKQGKTCDKPMCKLCAVHVEPDIDYCQKHAEMKGVSG